MNLLHTPKLTSVADATDFYSKKNTWLKDDFGLGKDRK